MTVDVLNTTRDWTQTMATDWILVVDDHPLFCDAMELTLRSVIPGTDVQTADTLEMALSQLEQRVEMPILIALDLNLPDVSGLDGILKLRRIAANTPLIVVSSMSDNRIVSSVMKAGASGFVPKHSPRAVFEEAIKAIRDGGSYLPANFAETDDPSAKDEPEAVERLSLLTAQQSRILQLICEGKLNKQIAFDLSIAETTVKAHVTAIMRKLGVQSRTQAVLVAQQAKFASILPEHKE